jgi:hypothetical protein
MRKYANFNLQSNVLGAIELGNDMIREQLLKFGNISEQPFK